MTEQDSLEDEEDDEAGLSELESLVSDITHIITCLYKFSIAIQNPAPKERLHKIELIKVSHFEDWDIRHIDEKFRPDPQNDFKVAEYLTERLGKANTRRRQLLKYYQAHHKKIAQHIDGPEPLKGVIERNELANAPKLVTPIVEGGSTRSPDERAVTIPTITKSQTTVSTIQVERTQAAKIEWGEDDRLSQTSYATSTNRAIRIRVPSPPNEIAAFEGEPFECPYCFHIIKIKTRKGWKYVLMSSNVYGVLRIFLENMYLGIFNPMSAHSSTALRQMNYTAANESGLTMRYSFTTGSGTAIFV